MENITKYSYSKRISASRYHGEIDEAINIALEAKEKYPNENIFEKILGDLYLQKNDDKLAGKAYLDFLIKIGDNIQYVKHFAQFMQRYSKLAQDLDGYIQQVIKCLDDLVNNENIVIKVCEIISDYSKYTEIEMFKNDKNFESAVKYIHKINNSCQLYILYCNVLSIKHSENNKRIDKYVVSSMEKNKRYGEALMLIIEVLKYDQDQVAVRTLFRICRKLEDYSEAEKYILTHPGIQDEEAFNILYELVFYYSQMGDVEKRDKTLEKIEVCGRESIPIMRTLYNFYLQFGLLDKAVSINSKISQMHSSKKYYSNRREQEDDAAEALLKTIQEMFAELEHSRKLISMSELLKGFSHELGQPITNIRYNVQLFQMKMEQKVYTECELEKLLEDILSQTYRIKKLLTRFSPITSEKNNFMNFSVINEIQEVFNEFSPRLSKENIEWKIEAKADFSLFGDNVKFDQIFYNLIGNSIYAIREKGEKGFVLVTVLENKKEFIITFEDNGIGIEPKYIGKVFEPFFTTKECSGNENGGGEGLGLYIIWNIVRIFDGKIMIDKEYKDGAKFVIKILKRGERRRSHE
ncbi:ATP-binding protein [Lachnospiraceae bacterium 38-14]